MGDTCHIGSCDNTSYDNCKLCGEPTCEKHGRQVGDGDIVCFECISRLGDDE